MPLAYLDSSILVSWALHDSLFPKSKQLLDEISSGKTTGVVSTLAVSETIDVIRKRTTESMPHSGDTRADITRLQLIIRQKVTDFVNGLTALSVQKKLIWDDPLQTIDNLLSEMYDVLSACKGNFGSRENCSRCRQPLDRPQYKLSIAGQYDVQHAIMARLLSADRLKTLDYGFRELASFPNFSSVSFDIL